MADLHCLISGLTLIFDFVAAKKAAEKAEKGTQSRNMNQSNVNLFCILPRNALRQILPLLDLKTDLSRVAGTCRVFNTVIHSRTYHFGLFSLHSSSQSSQKAQKDQSFTFALGATRSNSRSFDDEDMSEQDTMRLLLSAEATNNLLADKMKQREARNRKNGLGIDCRERKTEV